MNAVKKKSALLLSSTAPVGGFGESPAVDTLIELLNPLSAFINGKPKGSLNLWQEETKKHHPMDRLIGLEPSNRVTVRIEPAKRCYGCLTLRNVMHTMPVAYRLLPLNRPRFNVRPETGIIAPLATLTVEITYLPPPPPAPLLPESVPESDESFFLDSVVAAGASVKDGASFSSLDAVPADWFTAKKKQVFSDSGIRLYFVGSAVLSRLVADGDMVKVREVLEFSDREWHSADSVDARGQTLLHLAISRGRADLVQLILEFDANVNATNLAGRSALEAAAAVGEVLIAELLLARGASTRRSQGSNWGPLHHSAAAGHLELLQLLLLHGAAPDLPAADGLTALHLAAEERRRECVATLLSAGARAEARGGAAGYTALHVAASTGDEATARLLVEKGCAGLREARDSAGMTAYDVAAKEGHRGLFVLLRLGETLAAAARKGEVRTSARAIEKGASPDWRDGNGWTPLMRAGFKGKLETMRFLLEKGAAVDMKEEEGYTALHCAAEAGQVDAVDMLVKMGAEIEARTSKGRTAMDIASSLGYAGIVRILLQCGTSKVAAAPVAATRVVETMAMAAAKEKVEKGSILRDGEEKKKEARMVEREGSDVLFRTGFVDCPTAKAVASY